jgi:SAM-dependent methyltransferase
LTEAVPEDRPSRSFGDAIEAHRVRVAEVLTTGDANEIKRLYVELGELIDKAVDGDPSAVPALSFPEIGPVLGAMSEVLTGRVLDAGCGPNPIFSIMLGGRNERTIVSLDISPEIVRLAVKRASNAGVRVLGVAGDLEALPFRDSVFDGCICEDTIEHVPDDMKGAEELARVLVSSGRLLIGTPNRVRADVIRNKIVDRFRGDRKPPSAYYAASSHLREYTWASLQRVVSPWFRIKRRVTVGWDGGRRARLATVLVQRWPLRWFGRMVILDAEPRKNR